jgi:hypothetical protein
MVQVALPETPVDDPEYLPGRMREALGVAATWAGRKRIDVDFREQERLIAQL